MNIQVICQNCGSSLEIPYVRLGTTLRCEHCMQYTVPKMPTGAQMPETGNALSYSDFRGLIEYAPYRSKVEHLLAEWFDYSVAAEGRDIHVLNDQEEAIDPLWLHLRIQASSDLQKKLYQTAMALWS
jgi:hypothetical protein